MINNTPYDQNTHSNPWLMETNNEEAIIGPENIPLTASYIWSKNGKDREDLVSWVFDYYRKKSFIKSSITDEHILKEFQKLKEKKSDSVINDSGYINNSSNLCNDVFKHFVWNKYYSARGNEKSKSVIDVFNNDELFLNVLKNRMGYCISKEDGEERPYVFTITNKMILQGIKSTGFGYNVSIFKPLVGKYLYEKYAKSKVFDYSSGWGARCLSALSLNLEYYGVDPLTSSEINNIIKHFGGSGHVIEGCSEDINIYKEIPQVDCIMSCPPYFGLEIYDDNKNQSINKFKKYEDWINFYWAETVKNCMTILQNGGFFILIVKDFVGKYSLSKNMKEKCEDKGLVLKETMYYKTSTSHLSSKKKTGKVSKNNEIVFVFIKQ